jgi:hypothetical protein
MCECQNRITNKLELTLKGGVVPVQPLCDVAFLLVILVVWRERAVGVSTVKMALPELCKHRQNTKLYIYPVPDPVLLRKPYSAGKRTRDLCICSQEL